MRKAILLLLIPLLWACQRAPKANDEDWAQYKKDNYHSAISQAKIQLKDLGLLWHHKSPQAPVPSWYGPAKEDAYANSGPLPSMRDYDLAYYPIIVNTHLYYSSSADDALRCLDTQTGKELWNFKTDGPIHNAPTYHQGFLYFGSDDGYMYCINAFSGNLKWKMCPSNAKHQKIFNNGRLISLWPIRTGGLIENGILYFGASMLPWETTYFCAVNAKTGKTDLPETYIKQIKDDYTSFEGAMASTGKLLIQPQGRISPVFIDKKNGEKKGNLPGTGGCFVLVTKDSSIVHGQTSRYKSIMETTKEKPDFMTFRNGKEMIVKGDTSFVLNENSIAAYHRKTKKLIWLRRSYKAHRIIVVGNTLFAGETDKVYGISTQNGMPLWEASIRGTVYALSFAHKALYASTDEGEIYCFKAKGEKTKDIKYYPENKTLKASIDEQLTLPRRKTFEEKLKSTLHPFIEAINHDSVLLQFETPQAEIGNIIWKCGKDSLFFSDHKKQKNHFIKLPVRKNFVYTYHILLANGKKITYEYDNYFNFNRRIGVTKVVPNTSNKIKQYLKNKFKQGGICIVLGENSIETAEEIANCSKLNVIGLTKKKNHNDIREKLTKQGLYGEKISILKIKNETEIPIISDFADLVWVNNGNKLKPDPIIRLISPHHHAVINGIKDAKAWLEKATLDWTIEVVSTNHNTLILKKKPFENIGSWTHEYGRTDNSSNCGEKSLWGSSSRDDFAPQWMGRPGPRFITDRSGRKPSPLAIDGKMFVQGNQRIAAINIYNGTILWEKDCPGLMRMNITRDCSNWAADKDFLYVQISDRLYKIRNKTGEIATHFPVQKYKRDAQEWAYIGILPHQIIGSSAVKGSHFINYHGGGTQGWYDAQSGPSSYKMLSNSLFSFSKKEAKKQWQYTPKKAILNATITIKDHKIVFVETRSANRNSLKTGRGGDEIYSSSWLVQLDVNTGKKIWEQRLNTQIGRTAYYLAAGEKRYVIVSSGNGVYDIQGFDSETGERVWKQKTPWFHGDHGAHMSKPAIAGNRLVVKPFIYNLQTGKRANYNMPKAGHGCAHYALTEQSIFYRGYSLTFFNFDNRNFSKWDRLRPDCWLSSLPAEGMVLAPESAGGCSCGIWLETSMVLAPKHRTPITISGMGNTYYKDYKDETWGKYSKKCPFNLFKDSLRIKLSLQPDLNHPIYYTTDGSEPTRTSSLYKSPFYIHKSSIIKTAIFVKKASKDRKLMRSQSFKKENAPKEKK